MTCVRIVLDDTMTMAKHVSHTCRMAYYHLHNIASIRRSLTTSACKIIVHSLDVSRLDFGNATLYGISEVLLHRLQVLQNSAARLSFNSTGIFLSHITPDTSFHFIHPILILLLTSACEPPSLVNSDPRHLNDVTVGSSASTSFTVVSGSCVGLGKHSVFVLLIFSPCLSNTTLRVCRSSSTSSRVIAHSTRSSANIIAQGGSFSMFSVRMSIIIMNKRGLRADPWCNPISIGKYSVSPFCVTSCVWHDLYMSCTMM